MIYGNKLLNTDNLAMITLEQDLYNINLLLDESVVITESFDFGEIIDKMFTKIKEVLIKILNAISNIVNKILPAGYNAIQKVIANIMNSMKTGREKIDYHGQYKIYTVLNLTNEMQKITGDVASAGFNDTFKEIDDIYDKYFASLAFDEKQLKEKIVSFNKDVKEYDKVLENMLKPYKEFLSTVNDEYLEEVTQQVRSAQDYANLKKFLEDMADENMKWSKILKDIAREIELSINSIKFTGSLKAGWTELVKKGKKININEIVLATPKPSLLSDIPRIFSKVIEIHSMAIKPEARVVNEISKSRIYIIKDED